MHGGRFLAKVQGWNRVRSNARVTAVFWCFRCFLVCLLVLLGWVVGLLVLVSGAVVGFFFVFFFFSSLLFFFSFALLMD